MNISLHYIKVSFLALKFYFFYCLLNYKYLYLLLILDQKSVGLEMKTIFSKGDFGYSLALTLSTKCSVF